MLKVDCIVLWWGHLITWRWTRSTVLKWSEYIHCKELWCYILETLSNQKEKIGNIVYLGDNLSHKIDLDVHYIPSSPSKGCIPSVCIWNEALKIVWDTKNEVVLIICSDIPLVGKDELSFVFENLPTENDCATLFWIDNNKLQAEYPDFNSAKRFLELQEQDFIFWNALLIKKDALNDGLQFLKELDDNWIHPKKVLQLFKKLSFKNFILACKFIIFWNIKFFDGKIPNIFKKISKPTLNDLISFIEAITQKKWISLINNAPSELAIDYDRISQYRFFWEKL